MGGLGADETIDLAADPEQVAHELADKAANVDVVLDYLWGKPAESAIMPLLTGRDDRARLISWVQIGAVAGAGISLPSAALRQANIHFLGSGQGSVSAAGILSTLPELAAEIGNGAFTRSMSSPKRCPTWSRSGTTREAQPGASCSSPHGDRPTAASPVLAYSRRVRPLNDRGASVRCAHGAFRGGRRRSGMPGREHAGGRRRRARDGGPRRAVPRRPRRRIPSWHPRPAPTSSRLEFDGLTHDYRLHVPPAAATGKPLPLVLNLHGATQNAQLEEITTDMDPNADMNGYLVAYPDGTRISKVLTPDPVAKNAQYGWNAGQCCGLPVTKHINDVGFLLKVIADIAARTPVDLRHVSMTGISNGGMMAYAMAAEAYGPHRRHLVGVGPGRDPGDPPDPGRAHHGVPQCREPIAEFDGTPNANPLLRLSVMEGIDQWVKADGCDKKPRTGATIVGAPGPSPPGRRRHRSPVRTAAPAPRSRSGASPDRATSGRAARSTPAPRRTGSWPASGGASSSSMPTRRCGSSSSGTRCPPAPVDLRKRHPSDVGGVLVLSPLSRCRVDVQKGLLGAPFACAVPEKSHHLPGRWAHGGSFGPGMPQESAAVKSMCRRVSVDEAIRHSPPSNA